MLTTRTISAIDGLSCVARTRASDGSGALDVETPPMTRMPFASSTSANTRAAQSAGSPTASRPSHFPPRGTWPARRTSFDPGSRRSETVSSSPLGASGAGGAASAVVTEDDTVRQPWRGSVSSTAGSPTRSPGFRLASTRLSANERADTSAP